MDSIESMIDNRLLNTEQAADQLGMTRRGVQKAIERGLIVARKVGRSNLVTWGEVKRYMAERKPKGFQRQKRKYERKLVLDNP